MRVVISREKLLLVRTVECGRYTILRQVTRLNGRVLSRLSFHLGEKYQTSFLKVFTLKQAQVLLKSAQLQSTLNMSGKEVEGLYQQLGELFPDPASYLTQAGSN